MIGFVTIASLHMLALISPGPDFAIMVKNTLMYSKRHVIFTAIGIALGIIFHVIYCIMGFALVLSQSVIVFKIIKIIGACYLVYIGYKSLIAKPFVAAIDSSSEQNTVTKAASTKKVFWEGFWCNVLNPKATLFFLSLFTLVIDPKTPIWLQITYGVEMVLLTFAWFSMLGLMLSKESFKQKVLNAQKYINKLMGGTLVLFGAKLLLDSD